MIHVIAEITAQPGRRQDILDAYRKGLVSVLAEDGCIEFTIVIDADVVGTMHTQTKFGPDTFATIEKWASLTHLEAHSTRPGIDEYFKAIAPLLKSRAVHFLQSSQ